MRLAITMFATSWSAPTLGFGYAHRLLERGVGEHDHDARRIAPVAPLSGIGALRAFRGCFHRRDLEEGVEQRFRLVAAACRVQRSELRLKRVRIGHEAVVNDPGEAFALRCLDVAKADYLAGANPSLGQRCSDRLD